ncbi:HET-domain-containing protein [Microthyrium microscopicum]|uniref:HET-domain-containing protein n=1 Tax=Microthyrium microscopicum TaxID=703497 RepID=A0A6A6TTE4_9PEZI|nr:HET-domain-containing protein [Microthyrium microscopicum]
MAHDDFMWLDIPISTMLLASWGSYFYWISSAADQQWDKLPSRLQYGYTFTMVALFALTAILSALKKCIIFLAILFGPLLLVGFAATRSYQYFIFRLSSKLVFSCRNFRGPDISGVWCRLCQRCQGLVDQSPLLGGTSLGITKSNERHSFHTKKELERSATDCHMCILLLKSVEEFNESPEKETTSTETELTLLIQDRRPIGAYPASKLELELLGAPIKKSNRICVDGRSWSGNTSSDHGCFTSKQTDTQDIFNWAGHRIGECSRKHRRCDNAFVPEALRNYLPLRLLDVGIETDATISLKLGSELNEGTSKAYIALSHCWGEAVNLTLTKSNLGSMAIINESDLTKNFQDAIKITRALKLRHLWIDSLCIVQDDNTEWESQSANMGLVYANAQCVISASASNDSNGGCFMPKELFRNDCTLREAACRSLIVKAPGKQSFKEQLELFQDKAENNTISTRAWTFQERYLARRVLHFCDGVVFFECNELISRDGQRYFENKHGVRAGVRPDGTLHPPEELEAIQDVVESQVPATAKKRRLFRKPFNSANEAEQQAQERAQMELRRKLASASARSGMRGAFELLWRFKGAQLAEYIEFHQGWYEMVEPYSTRNLTRGSDKLKALSGVAHLIQQNTKFKYVAGLWQEMLACNLLWVVSGSVQERPTRNIPSWSWGSVDSQVSHRLQVVDSHQISDEGDSTLRSERFQSAWEKIMPLISGEKVDIIEQNNDLVLNATISFNATLHDSTLHYVNFIPDVVLPSSPGTLFHLPILAFKNTRVHPVGSDMQVHGLVVRAKESAEQVYARVGYFWTTDNDIVAQMLSPQGLTGLITLV